MNTAVAHALYYEALAADNRYSAVIAAHTGGRRNRWELTVEEDRLPAIRAAYLAKLAADDACLAFARAEWGEAHS